jgi:hypothetical protein
MPVGWRRNQSARLHDWVYCELADLDAAEYDEERSGPWIRGLLIRRNIAEGDMAFFSHLVSCWPRSKGIAGRSKIALRRSRANSGSITVKRAHGWPESARLARHARLRHAGRDSVSCKRHAAPENESPKDGVKDRNVSSPLIRWSVQESGLWHAAVERSYN